VQEHSEYVETRMHGAADPEPTRGAMERSAPDRRSSIHGKRILVIDPDLVAAQTLAAQLDGVGFESSWTDDPVVAVTDYGPSHRPRAAQGPSVRMSRASIAILRIR
jgi:hypothetical protein